MVRLIITEDEKFTESEVVNERHFGANLVTIYDEEFGESDSNLADLVSEIGVTNLRFPGGSATEHYFDMANPNSPISRFDQSEELLPMDRAFDMAGKKGIDLSIVVPTKRFFSESAAESILSGSYGSRREVSDQYLRNLKSFVQDVIGESEKSGAKVSVLEIGNEFWGAGQMTSGEYGYLVGVLLPEIESLYAENGLVMPDVIVQTLSSAGQVYTPREDTEVLVDPNGGISAVIPLEMADHYFEGEIPSGWVRATVPGQGPAYSQVADIASGINLTPGSADMIGGIVEHLYEAGGFSKVDESKTFFFDQFSRLENLLDRSSNASELNYHVSEWNTRSKFGENNRGAEHASMLVEIFFEQITHGIDVAEIWPLTFDNSQSVTLVDLQQENLTFAGETFKIMRDLLVGFSPILDWNHRENLDVHGFSNGDGYVFAVSERTGSTQDSLLLDFSEIIKDMDYEVEITTLYDPTGAGDNARSVPEVVSEDGGVSENGIIEFDAQAWSTSFIELLPNPEKAAEPVSATNNYVPSEVNTGKMIGTTSNDIIIGAEMNDRVFGLAGNDKIFGKAGDDQILGGRGTDTLKGEVGSDILKGKLGSDRLFGGNGSDTLVGGNGRDKLYGGNGNDVNRAGSGADELYGGSGNDKLYGGSGADKLYGGLGKDILNDGNGLDYLTGGPGQDTFVFSSDNTLDVVRDFQAGIDRIDLSAWGVNQPSELSIRSDKDSFADDPVSSIYFQGEELILVGASAGEMRAMLETDTFLF